MLRSGRAAVAVVAVVALGGCADGSTSGSARAGTTAASSVGSATSAPPGVTVVGRGVTTASPDVLRATVGVEVGAEDLAEAFERASRAADRVVEELRRRGVDDSDVQTRDLFVRDRRPEPPPPGHSGPPEPSGYVVGHMLDITIRDLDRAGEVLAGVADAGGDATRVGGLRFELTDDDEQRRAARQAAVEDARDEAEQYAELLGRELGDVVSIRDVGTGGLPPTPAAGRVESAPPVEPGQADVVVQAEVTWELR